MRLARIVTRIYMHKLKFSKVYYVDQEIVVIKFFKVGLGKGIVDPVIIRTEFFCLLKISLISEELVRDHIILAS